MQPWVWVLIAVLVIAAIIVIAVVVRSNRSRSTATRPTPQPPTAGPPSTGAPGQAGPSAPTQAAAPPGSAGGVTASGTAVAVPAEQEADSATAVEPQAPEGLIERPEPPASRLTRLRSRLASSSSPLGKALLSVLSRDHLTQGDWDELEETLLLADVGAAATADILAALQKQMRVEGSSDPARAKELLRAELLRALDVGGSRELLVSGAIGDDGKRQPGVVLVVGVNGSGKTTTIGRIARLLVAEKLTVVLGAADTFRAAATEQLATWGSRVGVPVVTGPEGGDPASVAFDTVREATTVGADVAIIDTAGRLQNKANLMEELGKIARVAAKQAPLTEVLLVLDATTGQNGLVQGRVFADVAAVTGIVLTKLDGSAKGGIVIAVQRELGVPVKLVGLGEGPDDLAPFDPEEFVSALLS